MIIKETLMRVQTRGAVAFVASLLLIPVVARAEPVAAAISTTLATDSKQIRQFAFDGVGDTFFASKENPRVADHFTLIFDRPVPVRSVGVVTGKPDPKHTGWLEAGVLEVLVNGKTFN